MEESVGFFELINAVTTTQEPLFLAGQILWYLFTHGGFIVVIYLVYILADLAWMNYIQNDYDSKRRWILLAIDIPQNNEQSPLAVENMFAQLAGAHTSPNLIDKYWKGYTQEWFSMEIVGIDGYVQFMIRCLVKYRDLVEGAIYAQYPEAQIAEVADYCTGYPTTYPDPTYDVYANEFIYADNQALPIRTYPQFEHPLTQEFKDPLSAVIETLGKLRKGEQLWLQILVRPTSDDWKNNSISFIKKTMGQKEAGSAGRPGIIRRFLDELVSLTVTGTNQIVGIPPPKAGLKADGSDVLSKILYLAPHEKEKAEGAARKIKKIGFLTKIRYVYIARHEVFHKDHGASAFVGAIKQFNTSDLNALKPDTKRYGVHANYGFTTLRKNIKKGKMMRWYQKRSVGYGRPLFIMNSEELATLWHFPVKTETTPIRHMVQRTEFKHTPPPATVPFVEESERPSNVRNQPNSASSNGKKMAEDMPPINLPTA